MGNSLIQFRLLKYALSIPLLTFCCVVVQAQTHSYEENQAPKEVNSDYPEAKTLQTMIEGHDPDEVIGLYNLTAEELRISKNTAKHELEGIEAKIEAKNNGISQTDSNQLIQFQSLEDLKKRKKELEKQIAKIEKHISPKNNQKE